MADWFIPNLGEIGTGTILIILFYLIVKEELIPGPFHRREVETGNKAIATLEVVNVKLHELEKIAVEQKIRDEYGRNEVEELKQELRICKSDLGQCRDTLSSDRGLA